MRCWLCDTENHKHAERCRFCNVALTKKTLNKPFLMFDTNCAPMPYSEKWNGDDKALCHMDYYFQRGDLTIARTEELDRELKRHAAAQTPGTIAYNQLRQLRLYKLISSDVKRALEKAGVADKFWNMCKEVLFPTTGFDQLNERQLSDVEHLFYAVAVSGSCGGAYFVTCDRHFLNKSDEIRRRFSTKVGRPAKVWRSLGRNSLYRRLRPKSLRTLKDFRLRQKRRFGRTK